MVVMLEIFLTVAIAVFTLGHVLVFHAILIGRPPESAGNAPEAQPAPMGPIATVS